MNYHIVGDIDGFHVRLMVGVVEVDCAGPFDNWEDAEDVGERAMEIAS